MKKFLALLISAVMVLSMLSTMALPAFADEDEDEIDPLEWINEYIKGVNGDWYTRRGATHLGKEENFTPAGGFYYDSEGFHSTSPDYTNMTPSYAIVSKSTYNLKEGFSMKIRIDEFGDEFGYKGESGTKDEWFSIAISDSPLTTPSDTTHGRGSGFTPLIRGAGNGSAEVQTFWTQTKNEEGKGGLFTHGGNANVSCEMEDGKEIYTLDVEWDGSAYTIKINGTTIAANSTISSNLVNLNDDGDFYISIICHSTISASPFAATILEVNGGTPAGSDNVEPDENTLVYGDMIDSSTVPDGEPALVFDANKTTFKSDPDMQNCDVVPNGDGSYTITSYAAASFVTWTVKRDLSYEATDFPYFAMLVKNNNGLAGQMYVLSGENLGSDPSCAVQWNAYDFDEDTWTREWEDDEGNYYNLIVIDLTADNISFTNEGRIHGCRIDFGGMDTTGEMPMDLYYMAYFRTEEDAQAYGEARVDKIINGDSGDDTGVVDIFDGGNMSADTYYENGETLQDGNAADWLAANRDLTENGISGVDSIGLRGWAYLDGKTAKSYGYLLMNSDLETEIIWDDSFLQDGSDVNSALGRTDVTRYTITVDLTKLAAGEYIVIPLFQTEDGTIATLSQWGVGGMIPVVVSGTSSDVGTETDSAADTATEPVTDPATEPATGDQATEPATGNETEVDSKVETSASTSAATTATEDDGCASVIGVGAAALVLSAMAAAVALKKKH